MSHSKTQPKIQVYIKEHCPFCDRAKALLNDKGLPFETIDLGHDHHAMNELKHRTGWMTFPQIFIGEKLIGGFQELSGINKSGELDRLMGLST